jgi:hypothetical protein
LAVSSFRLRARLDVSIPSAFFGQRGITPAFGYGAPHSSARGTSTLLNNALLSAHFPFADNPAFVASSATRYAGIEEMAATKEGGRPNRALRVAYIFLGVA